MPQIDPQTPVPEPPAGRPRAHEHRVGRLPASEFVVRLVEAEPSWMESIVASTHEAVVSYGPDGRIRSWNPGAERLYGYQAAEAVGGGISLTVPADRMEQLELAVERLEAGEHSLRLETVRLTKNGTLLDVARWGPLLPGSR